MKRSERQQSFFAGKAYLKLDSLVKTPLHEFMAVARSGLWAPATVQLARADLVARAEMGPSVGWNSLLIELFWPKLCSNGSRKG